MNKILVFQHVPYEILGTLNELFKSHGFRIKYVNFGRYPDAVPSLDGYHGLVVLGGPMSVYDLVGHPHLAVEVDVIRQALERGIPILGICLGAQLLARALDAEVTPNGDKEIGWYDVSMTDAGREDPMFAHFEASERIFQWHGDTFAIPTGATHLASSPLCRNQAFRYGEHAYGLQFHLEVDAPMIERWLGVPAFQAEIAELGGRVCADAIRTETRACIDAAMRLSDRTFLQFITHFGPKRRRVPHPHS